METQLSPGRSLKVVLRSCARWLETEREWQLQVVRHRERQMWRYGPEEKPKHAERVLPRRWVVERTFTWLVGQSRRLSKGYERLPETSKAMIHAAMSRFMLWRPARAA